MKVRWQVKGPRSFTEAKIATRNSATQSPSGYSFSRWGYNNAQCEEAPVNEESRLKMRPELPGASTAFDGFVIVACRGQI
jgi:hypothetical protein